MYFKSFPDKAEKNGSYPRVSGGTMFKTWFCHYVPVDLSEYIKPQLCTLEKSTTNKVI